jgi:cob(I)alamin adenosyltransferase
MPVYTRTGDQGETDLLGGARTTKDVIALEVCGTLDELNALIGLVRCEPLPNEIEDLLEHIQQRLFDVGGELVAIASGEVIPPVAIGTADIVAIEQSIDRHEAQLGPIKAFILPAGCRAAATLHLARAVCRRAERRLVSFLGSHPTADSPHLLRYVNRLSDLLYVLARAANAAEHRDDTPC